MDITEELVSGLAAVHPFRGSGRLSHATMTSRPTSCARLLVRRLASPGGALVLIGLVASLCLARCDGVHVG